MEMEPEDQNGNLERSHQENSQIPFEPADEEITPTMMQRFTRLFSRGSISAEISETAPEVDPTTQEQTELPAQVAQDRSRLATALAKAINSVTEPQDRQEVVNWFVCAYEILSRDVGTRQKVPMLYGLIDSKRVGKLIANTAGTTFKNYAGSDLPLSIKLALPITTLGACLFGAQGAGIAAFGGGIGVPVVLLLFLGSAGVASIIEALIKDKRNIEPATRLLFTLIQLENARRIKKELAEQLKQDLETPRRCEIDGDEAQILCELRSMDPFDFERHVMSFFEACGYPSGITRKSKDNGFDGWLHHPKGFVIAQCKRYAGGNIVGRPDLQQFKGVIEEQEAYHGYFVTTSTFSRDAIESAELSEKLTLIDHEILLAWHRLGKADLAASGNRPSFTSVLFRQLKAQADAI